MQFSLVPMLRCGEHLHCILPYHLLTSLEGLGSPPVGQHYVLLTSLEGLLLVDGLSPAGGAWLREQKNSI